MLSVRMIQVEAGWATVWEAAKRRIGSRNLRREGMLMVLRSLRLIYILIIYFVSSMKKWTILAAILLLVILVPIYVFIPGKLKILRVGSVACNPTGGFRALLLDSNWRKWAEPSGLDGDVFQFSVAYYHALGINVKGAGGWKAESRLNILPVGKDSVVMEWQCELPSSMVPWERIRQYRRAVRLKEEMDRSLARLTVFLSKKDNIYG